jgi:tetratricopeptide (TPR) repeat protein
MLFVFFGIATISKAQFFDELSNPQVTVNINHPPGLGLKINKVAFNAATGNCSEQINDALIQDFVSSKVDVIDRANLNTILAEHNLNTSGYIDQTSAVAIGKIIGPSALITAKVLRCETKKENLSGTEEKYDYKTKQKYYVKYYIERITTFLKVSIQTVDLTTGRIFAAKVFDYAPYLENKSYDGVPEAPSEFDNQERAYKALTLEVHKLFFAWTEQSVLYFFDDKDGGLKQAYQALKVGDIDGSFKLSVQNLETCKKSSDIKPKILAHAYYNLGMSYMIRNEYDKAIENFQEAQVLKPGRIISNTMSDCVKAKNLLIEMQKVDDKAAIEAQKIQTNTENAAKAQESTTLKNADVIALVQKKLPTSLILQKIKTSNCKFDTSTDALVALTNAGVSEDVIMLMMEKK